MLYLPTHIEDHHADIPDRPPRLATRVESAVIPKQGGGSSSSSNSMDHHHLESPSSFWKPTKSSDAVDNNNKEEHCPVSFPALQLDRPPRMANRVKSIGTRPADNNYKNILKTPRRVESVEATTAEKVTTTATATATATTQPAAHIQLPSRPLRGDVTPNRAVRMLSIKKN